MAYDRRKVGRDTVRNIVLLLLALAMLAIFFSSDPFKRGSGGLGSFFGRSPSKMVYTGALSEGELKLSRAENARIKDFVKDNDAILKRVEVRASKQDSYKDLTANAQILFEMEIETVGGTVVKTPVLRASRKDLVERMLKKLEKDLATYRDLRPGRDPGVRTNDRLMNVM
ncbi:MAG: hypothetical protein PHV85_11380 [Desulfovibrionaceae bacterium]|nr:hypothetical protein [Desulfovibrionaceae bacterium]